MAKYSKLGTMREEYQVPFNRVLLMAMVTYMYAGKFIKILQI